MAPSLEFGIVFLCFVFAFFGHLSYVERSPRFTRAALCNNQMKRRTKQLSTTKITKEYCQQPVHLASSPSTAPIYHLGPQFSWDECVHKTKSSSAADIGMKTSKHQLLLQPGVDNRVTFVFPPFVFAFLSDLLVKPSIDQNLRKNVCIRKDILTLLSIPWELFEWDIASVNVRQKLLAPTGALIVMMC